MRCFAEPRTDGLAKQPRCADGNTYTPAGWSKCRDNGSVRIQCPKNHYPCNTLTGSAELAEFKCSTNCADTVRAQQCQGRLTTQNLPWEYYCQNDYLFVCAELRCVAEPRGDDRVGCANGDGVAFSSGACSLRGGRLQCPKNHYPCNSLNSYNDFICDPTCDGHGGKRTTCYVDSNGDD